MSTEASDTFRVVVQGHASASLTQDVVAKLASRFSATPKQIEQVIRSPHYVLARGLTSARAEAYRQTLEESGVPVVVEDEGQLFTIELPDPEHEPAPIELSDSRQKTIRRMADYQKASGVVWAVLGAVQVLTVVGVFAGVWNVWGGVHRIRQSAQIRRREASVPAEFESISDLVIMALVNVFLGGVIGIVLVGFDFYLRDRILSHQHLFDQPSPVDPKRERKRVARLARATAKGT